MDLFSIGFVSFIAVFLILYYVLPKRFQPVILLFANILFYLVAGKWNLIFIMVTALTVWAGALKIGSFSDEYKKKRKDAGSDKEEKKRLKEKYLRKKRIVLALVLLINFGILAYMKYFRVLAGFKGGLLLPLGISFYTFQAAGYLIDVYGGKYDPEKRFPDFLLFVSFFPQLIQGPINRFDALKEQFKKDHVLTSEKVKNAVFLILYGLMKKYAVANMLSDSIEAVLGGDTASMPGSLIVFSILMYSAEQYADFSGGIDIVLGVAKLFDIEMMPNFRQPYFSTSLEDFWRRWHISLGAWMRDYVFYPFALLKFNQKAGKWSSEHINKHFGRVLPAAISNIVVFFLVGIWHGAYLHYVLWGLYNGLIIALADMLSPVFQS
ncbi:MAG: MBOAT family protein, partial [Lachnospiraceae bacterium]|nr:MBOAT family protein [Lachnospiraceae bacterium]